MLATYVAQLKENTTIAKAVPSKRPKSSRTEGEHRSFFKRPLFWLIGGLVMAGAGAGIAVGMGGGSSGDGTVPVGVSGPAPALQR